MLCHILNHVVDLVHIPICFTIFSDVMQTDGFDYLKESCPSVITDLLQYVASEHHSTVFRLGNEAILDGSDINGRRVKQRL